MTGHGCLIVSTDISGRSTVHRLPGVPIADHPTATRRKSTTLTTRSSFAAMCSGLNGSTSSTWLDPSTRADWFLRCWLGILPLRGGGPSHEDGESPSVMSAKEAAEGDRQFRQGVASSRRRRWRSRLAGRAVHGRSPAGF